MIHRSWRPHLVGALVVLLGVASAWSETAARSKADRVSVRSRPGLSGEVVARLARGQEVGVLGEVKGGAVGSGPSASTAWMKVALPAGTPVWADAELLDPVTRTVKADVLQLRAGPSWDHGTVGRVRRGTRLELRGDPKGGWQEVGAPAGCFGYVHASLLEPAGPGAPSPVPAATAAAAAPSKPVSPASAAPATGSTVTAPVPAPVAAKPVAPPPPAPAAAGAATASAPVTKPAVSAATSPAAAPKPSSEPASTPVKPVAGAATASTNAPVPVQTRTVAAAPVTAVRVVDEPMPVAAAPAGAATNAAAGAKASAPAKTATTTTTTTNRVVASAPVTNAIPAAVAGVAPTASGSGTNAPTPAAAVAVVPESEPVPGVSPDGEEPGAGEVPAMVEARKVRREGLVVRPFNIQAPSYYALQARDSKKTVNFLFSTRAEPINWKEYRGRVVIVSGREYLDSRFFWQKVPLLDVESIEAVR